MSLTLIGKKRGMTRIFCSKTGKNLPCTVIELKPNLVVKSKSKDGKDGYNALVMGGIQLSEQQIKRSRKPDLGIFKNNLSPMKVLVESRGEFDYKDGDLVDAEYFSDITFVDVRGRTKGKGYQGPIKRHGVSRVVSSHGAGPIVRHVGSSGFMTSHGRVHKGKVDSGQMGDDNHFAECLQVLEIDKDNNVILVKGCVPGANNSVVYIRSSVKKSKS